RPARPARVRPGLAVEHEPGDALQAAAVEVGDHPAPDAGEPALEVLRGVELVAVAAGAGETLAQAVRTLADRQAGQRPGAQVAPVPFGVVFGGLDLPQAATLPPDLRVQGPPARPAGPEAREPGGVPPAED